jgi:hypothetical protein
MSLADLDARAQHMSRKSRNVDTCGERVQGLNVGTVIEEAFREGFDSHRDTRLDFNAAWRDSRVRGKTMSLGAIREGLEIIAADSGHMNAEGALRVRRKIAAKLLAYLEGH